MLKNLCHLTLHMFKPSQSMHHYHQTQLINFLSSAYHIHFMPHFNQTVLDDMNRAVQKKNCIFSIHHTDASIRDKNYMVFH